MFPDAPRVSSGVYATFTGTEISKFGTLKP
jgi:hypothetical protein